MIITGGKMQGFYRLQVMSRGGILKKDTGYFSNLILNSGLDQIASYNIGQSAAYGIRTLWLGFSVGTGTTPPTNSDTTLENRIAYINTPEPNTAGSDITSSSTYQDVTTSMTFGTGDAAGNITEVGVGNYPSSGNPDVLFSRALVLDSGGNPTTLVVTSDDILIVTYVLRVYFDMTTHNGSVTVGGTSYPYSSVFNPSLSESSPGRSFIPGSSDTSANPGLGVIESGGGSLGPYAVTYGAAYSPGTYTQAFSHTFGSTSSNRDISRIDVHCWLGGRSITFSPAVPVLAGQSTEIDLSVTWGRYP